MKKKEDILIPENKGKENDSEEQKKMVGENEESTSKDAANHNEDSGLGDMEENQEENNGTPELEPAKILTAVHPILYLSHQYKIGDELPANDPKMVDAWITAGTAVWTPSKVPTTKAKVQTAEPGLFGQAVPPGDDDLIGRVPVRGRWR